MKFTYAEWKVLDSLKRDFFQQSEYGVLDNWIIFQYEKNLRNGAKTREVLAKDKEDRIQIEKLHEERKALKEKNCLEAQKLADEIEVLVRQRNMKLEEVKTNNAPYVVIDVHWLTVTKTLNYVSQVESALKDNARNLTSQNQVIQVITGHGQQSDKKPDEKKAYLKMALLDAYAGRIVVQDGNNGVLNLIVRQRPSVWDYVDVFIKSRCV